MKRTLFLLLILTVSGFAQVIPGGSGPGPASSIVGQIQTATGGVIKDGTLNFTLSQPAVSSGTASIVTQASACYTSNQGNIVGLPEPVPPPIVNTNTSVGSLVAGTYYVVIYYINASNAVSAVSPETVITLSSTGSLIVSAPLLQPSVATGYGVAISSASGTESIQGSVTGWGHFSQAVALTTGNPPQATNNSVCNVWFSDSLVPTGTYYTVNLVNKHGSQVAGFPQTWCTYGGVTGTIDVSQGAPTGNCNTKGVFYPTPIFSQPPGSGQSIIGNLSVSGTLTAGALTAGAINFLTFATAGESVADAVARLPLGGGGTIIFGAGTYPSGNVLISTPGITLQGAGMPSYNGTYTALTGPGTIIKGPINAIQGADHFVVRDLGVDAGSAWVNTSNGGVAVTALGISNQGQVVGAPQVQAPIIENVSCLGFSPSSANHCMLVENVNDASIKNITTVYNVYGLAFKGTNSTISGVWARSHGTNAIIIKSDTYAVSSNVNLSNFNIGNVNVGDTFGGLYLTAVGAPLTFINVSNGSIQNPTNFGIFLQGGATTPVVSEVNINNVTIDSALELGAHGVVMTGFDQFVNFSNLNISNVANGIHLNLPAAGLFNHIRVSNSSFAFITGNGVETFDFAGVTGCSFVNMANGIVSNSGTTAVSNNTFVGVTNNYSGTVQFGGVATIDNSSNVTFPANLTGATVLSSTGLFGPIGSNTISINALATPTALSGTSGQSGLLVVRDNTSGGMALFGIDPNGGSQLIGVSQITGLAAAQVTYSSGWRLALSAGATPRVLAWSLYAD